MVPKAKILAPRTYDLVGRLLVNQAGRTPRAATMSMAAT